MAREDGFHFLQSTGSLTLHDENHLLRAWERSGRLHFHFYCEPFKDCLCVCLSAPWLTEQTSSPHTSPASQAEPWLPASLCLWVGTITLYLLSISTENSSLVTSHMLLFMVVGSFLLQLLCPYSGSLSFLEARSHVFPHFPTPSFVGI